MQPFDVRSVFFSLPGKQDYKKTKSVLKATRLKAEAKKNFSGFRVRLDSLSLLYLQDFLYFCSPVLSCPICDSACLSACQPFLFFHLSVFLHAFLSLHLTRSLFISQTLCCLTTYCWSFGYVTISIHLKLCDVAPCLSFEDPYK